jgi:hypothetical protein
MMRADRSEKHGIYTSEVCSWNVDKKICLQRFSRQSQNSCYSRAGRDDVVQSPESFFSKTQHEAKRLMKKSREKQSLSEVHQCLPSQADRSQTLKRIEIITAEAGAKAQGITLRRWGCISSARLEFCGSFEEFR